MKELGTKEIEQFSLRKGVRKIAVENFLMSMGNDAEIAEKNLDYDAGLYNWNGVTVKAIRDGIKFAKK